MLQRGQFGSATGAPRILCVDDESNVLEGLRRVLGFDYDVVTETDPFGALYLLEQDPSFAVVVSDFRMPRMDGTLFLASAKRVLPNTTRVLLTGSPDLSCAVAAVNRGGIFRFLVKPCPEHQLVTAIQAAVTEHRNMTAARPREIG